MDEPLVCCICPTHRTEYLERSQACFDLQTYPNRKLFIFNNSGGAHGSLRNQVIAQTPAGSIIAHWDDDDWSCPTRLAEQVSFLQSTGANIVGYRDMPFYDVRTQQVTFYKQPNQHYALGTSLMYWRSVWEQHPFIEVAGDEDSKFEHAVGFDKVQTQSSIYTFEPCGTKELRHNRHSPMMVARIHPGNTSPKGGARYEKATPELRETVLSCLFPANVAHSISA